jgi:NADH-quinone oxidoreductase subunit G
VPLYHIFGSEELSARASAVSKRVVKPYVLIHQSNAEKLKVVEGQNLSFEIAGQSYVLPVRISTIIKPNVAGFPSGLPGVPYSDLPAWGVIRK